MAKWDVRPERNLARCGTPGDATRIRELEAALAATEREREAFEDAWVDAQRRIIRLTAEVARLRGAATFLRRVR